MARRFAPEAEAELDDIWYYIAKQSGSIENADRVIDSITDRFVLLARGAVNPTNSSEVLLSSFSVKHPTLALRLLFSSLDRCRFEYLCHQCVDCGNLFSNAVPGRFTDSSYFPEQK